MDAIDSEIIAAARNTNIAASPILHHNHSYPGRTFHELQMQDVHCSRATWYNLEILEKVALQWYLAHLPRNTPAANVHHQPHQRKESPVCHRSRSRCFHS